MEPKLSINENISEQQLKKNSVGISLLSVNLVSIKLENKTISKISEIKHELNKITGDL